MKPSYHTIVSFLQEQTQKYPQAPCLGGVSGWLDRQTVQTLVEHTASALVRLGICEGTEIAFPIARNAEASIMLLALRAAGAVAVLTDPRRKVSEFLKECSEQIPVQAVIMQEDKTVFRICFPDREEKLDLYALSPADTAMLKSDASCPAFVIFTSGSTGKSKAVVLSESCLVNDLLDTQALGMYYPDDRALGAIPLHHVFGLVLLVGVAVLGYGLYYPEKMEIPVLLQAVEKEKLTRMNGVPSLYLALADQSEGYDLRSLRAGFIGGGPVSKEQFVYIEAKLEMTLISAYGMSECIGISCSSWKDPQAVRAGGVGPFYPTNIGRILRENGTEASVGEEGEICVRGPTRMLGYYGHLLPEQELLHTGDLGYLDENGVLHISGRKKDIIIRNGNNLSARKIEEVLLSVPTIKAAAVVGLADERQGEIPAAMIVGEIDMTVLGELLQKNEMPVLVMTVDSLPMTTSGKTDKMKVREELTKWRNG